MKRILFLILALGLFSNSMAQDLLFTAKGNLIRCKILAQTDKLIFISTIQPDGTSINSYVSKDTIRTIASEYTGEMNSRIANKTAIAQMNRQIRKRNRPNGRPITEVARFALTAGYSHLLDFSDEYDTGFSDYSGFTVNGDLGGFFNDYIGLGAFANYSHYNKKNIHNLIVGPNSSSDPSITSVAMHSSLVGDLVTTIYKWTCGPQQLTAAHLGLQSIWLMRLV